MNRFFASTLLVVFSAASLTQAAIKTAIVDYKEGDVDLQGFVAYDDAIEGKRPGVLVVHEWYGLNDYAKSRAEQLAGMGYVAFAADIYGKGIRATTPEEAGKLAGKYKNDRPLLRKRVIAAFETLKKQEKVDTGKIAAIGYCFGGTTVLELARAGTELSGVVSFHGGLSATLPAKEGDLKTKILVLHGADDPFISDEEMLAFRTEMQTAKADWQLVAYGNSVHAFTNKANDGSKLKGAKYNADADRRSWKAMQDFFAEIFGGK